MVSILGLVLQALACLEQTVFKFALGLGADDLLGLYFLFTRDRLEGPFAIIVAVPPSEEIHSMGKRYIPCNVINPIKPVIASG